MAATDKQLRERWKTAEGQERLKAVIEAVQRGEWRWEGALRGFAFVDEVENGRDLRGANLSKADLRKAHLSGADLSGADLSAANLSGAGFGNANLTRACLSAADLSGAHLSTADLSGILLSWADLSGAHLSGADLSEADLSGAKLSEADLSGAKLLTSDLREVNLSEANLSEANLSEANLYGVNLRDANLIRACLSGANLYEAALGGADLGGADLRRAVLSKADLSGTDLTWAKLSMAKLSEANLCGALLHGADLSEADLGEADLSDADLSWANLSGALFGSTLHPGAYLSRTGADLNRTRFYRCGFDKDTDFRGVDIRLTDWTNDRGLERHIKDQQWLDGWRERIGRARWGSVRKPEDDRLWRCRWGRVKFAVLDFLWRWTCDYGRSVWRWVVCSTAIALVFAVIFFLFRHRILLPNMSDGQTLADAHPFMCVYYSIVTFTTLGFGDVVPQPGDWLMQAIVVCEVILGYVMLGGLISLFTSKLARRS